MFHVKLGRPISQTSGKEGGGTATSRASRRCSSCASESSRSEFLESVAPARNSEGPAFAEPPVETRGRFASSHRAGRAIAMHGIAPSRRALSAPLPSHPSRALPPRASLPAAFRCPAHLTQVYRTPASDRNQRRNRLLHLNGKNRTSGAGKNGRRETQLATPPPSRRSREGWAKRNGGKNHGKGKRNCFKEASPLPAPSLGARGNLLRHAEALEGPEQRQP